MTNTQGKAAPVVGVRVIEYPDHIRVEVAPTLAASLGVRRVEIIRPGDSKTRRYALDMLRHVKGMNADVVIVGRDVPSIGGNLTDFLEVLS